MPSDPRHIEFPDGCHPHTIAIYEYWLRKCGPRRMPARSDIDPTEMDPKWLPGICLVDVVPDDRQFVYRLVGTGEVEVRGEDPTGRSVKEGFFGFSADDAVSCYARVARRCAPLLDASPFRAVTGRFVTEETIFLPLGDEEFKVSKVLVFSHSRDLMPSNQKPAHQP